MKKLLSMLAFVAMSSFFFSACKEDDDVAPKGTVSLEFTNIAGNKNVDTTGGTTYTTALGQSFNVKRLKYYISNVKLMKNNAVVYTMPESYFLVDESKQSSTKLSIPDVPNGSYDRIQFLVGVDSLRNVSGAQSGALTPSDMFWSWSTGYIFFKMEGESSSAPGGNYVYHIAGYKDPNVASRTVDLTFNGASLVVEGSREAEIHVFADILKVFNGGPATVDLSTTYNVMTTGANSMKIADNYADMFTFDHLHN
jgi:hypothetical protein